MSVEAALKNPLFQEESKLVITSGDRSDMIGATLESKAAAVILTNNILPSPVLISKAAASETPLLIVSADTCEIVKQIEGMEALLTDHDKEKIARIEQLVRTHVDLQAFSKTGRQT
jgi:BioD-like phosphotransacetylase family protein